MNAMPLYQRLKEGFNTNLKNIDKMIMNPSRSLPEPSISIDIRS